MQSPGRGNINEGQQEFDHGKWLDRFFASYYAHRPVNATFIGVRGYDHALPDFGESAVGDLDADARALLSEASRARGPTAATALDLKLAKGFLELQRWEYTSGHFHRGNPSFHTGEAVFGVMAPFLARSLEPADRLSAAVERMHQVPDFLSVARACVRDAPGVWTRRAARECEGALAFLKSGWQRLPEVTASGGVDGNRDFERAAAAASQSFAEHRAILLSGADSASDVSPRAAGEEAFGLYLEKGHFLSENAGQIARYAREELQRSQSSLEEAASKIGVSDATGALDQLQDIHPPVEGYYERYAELWDLTRATAEAHELITWPEFPIEYVARPEWAREAAPSLYFLFYRSPAAINRPDVHRYHVTPIDPSWDPEEQERLLRANNDSVIKLNHVLHHGSIGHHVQNWNAFRAQSQIGRVAAVDCASRIAMFCGLTMAEGWACYATDLMAEHGMLTELEQLAENRSRTRMCARAIVDIEFHTGRMTFDECVAFYQEEAGMPEVAARREAVKNSMFPGAALIYLVGSDAIAKLRRDLTAAQGSAFSMREFHDTFLSFGSIPVSLVAETMRREAGLDTTSLLDA